MADLSPAERFAAPAFVRIDAAAPDFGLPAYDPIADEDLHIPLAELRGRWVVLFWYPADFTFVCPTELKDMADAKARFDALGVIVLAVSTDTVYSHRAWVRSEPLMQGFPYAMLADHGLDVSHRYGILDPKSGIAGRGTFILDPQGVVRGIEVTSGPLGRNSDELLRKIEALQHMAANPGVACPAKWAIGAKTLRPSIKFAGEVGQELAK